MSPLLLTLPIEIQFLIIRFVAQDAQDVEWARFEWMLKLSHCNRDFRHWFLSSPMIWQSIILRKAQRSESIHEFTFLQLLSMVEAKESVRSVKINHTDLISFAGMIRILETFPKLEDLSLVGSYGFRIQDFNQNIQKWIHQRSESRPPLLRLKSLDLTDCGVNFVPENHSIRDVRGHRRLRIMKNKGYWSKFGIGLVTDLKELLSSISYGPVKVKPGICEICSANTVNNELKRQDCFVCKKRLPQTCHICQPGHLFFCSTCQWNHQQEIIVCAACAETGLCQGCQDYLCSECFTLNDKNLCEECAMDGTFSESEEGSEGSTDSEEQVEEEEQG